MNGISCINGGFITITKLFRSISDGNLSVNFIYINRTNLKIDISIIFNSNASATIKCYQFAITSACNSTDDVNTSASALVNIFSKDFTSFWVIPSFNVVNKFTIFVNNASLISLGY